jgi:hypothetical protein
MLRHSVLWTLRDTTTTALRLEMLKGLAFLGTECPSVRHGDYGDDLFAGSRAPAAAPGAEVPMWRREALGPPTSFDAALHLDFDDWPRFAEYGADSTHEAASRFNESVSWDELTARVDWYYDGEHPTVRGHVKHVAMFVWADDLGDRERQSALDAVHALAESPEVEFVATGINVGVHPSDYDWILDVQIPDLPAAAKLLGSSGYASALEAVAAVTKFEWTARVTHLMRGR